MNEAIKAAFDEMNSARTVLLDSNAWLCEQYAELKDPVYDDSPKGHEARRLFHIALEGMEQYKMYHAIQNEFESKWGMSWSTAPGTIEGFASYMERTIRAADTYRALLESEDLPADLQASIADGQEVLDFTLALRPQALTTSDSRLHGSFWKLINGVPAK